MKEINVKSDGSLLVEDVENNDENYCYEDFIGISLSTNLPYGATYSEIVELFGEPFEGDGYKVDAEWNVIVNNKRCTIYNYKTGINYNGIEGTPTELIKDWHIGTPEGNTDKGLELGGIIIKYFMDYRSGSCIQEVPTMAQEEELIDDIKLSIEKSYENYVKIRILLETIK